MRRRLFGWLVPMLAAMLLAFGPLPGHTQAPPIGTPPGLTLTPAQQARAQARQQQYAKDMTALQANTSLTPAQKAAKGAALYKAMDTDMLAILTPAQRSKILIQRKTMVQKQQGFVKAHQTEIAQGKALAAKLSKSLTPAQKAQITKLQQQLTAEGQALQSDTTTSPQAKQQKWITEQQDSQTKMLAVLTPSQKANFIKIQQLQKQLMTEAKTMPPSK